MSNNRINPMNTKTTEDSKNTPYIKATSNFKISEKIYEIIQKLTIAGCGCNKYLKETYLNPILERLNNDILQELTILKSAFKLLSETRHVISINILKSFKINLKWIMQALYILATFNNNLNSIQMTEFTTLKDNIKSVISMYNNWLMSYAGEIEKLNINPRVNVERINIIIHL